MRRRLAYEMNGEEPTEPSRATSTPPTLAGTETAMWWVARPRDRLARAQNPHRRERDVRQTGCSLTITVTPRQHDHLYPRPEDDNAARQRGGHAVGRVGAIRRLADATRRPPGSKFPATSGIYRAPTTQISGVPACRSPRRLSVCAARRDLLDILPLAPVLCPILSRNALAVRL